MKTRRQFVMAGTAGALIPLATTAAVLPGGGEGRSVMRRLGGMPAQSVFERLAGQAFSVGGGGTLTLDAVRPCGAGQKRLEQFTLVMRGHPSRSLEAGLHELRHPDTGRIALHLSPSGARRGAPLYRADISLIV